MCFISGAVALSPERNATDSATKIMMEKKRLRVWPISRQKSFCIAFFIAPPPFLLALLLPFDALHACRMLIELHALHRAVFDVDHAVGHRRDGAVVRDDHDRHTLFPAGILQEL